MWGWNNVLWILVTLETALRVDVVSFLVFLWLIVLSFWQKSWYFPLGGCGGPGSRATITVIWWRFYFTLGWCCGAARWHGLSMLHPHSSFAVNLKWMRLYRLMVQWTGLPLQCLLLWLHCCEVGLSPCCCLTITVFAYCALGGCCAVKIIYFTLGGCCGTESKLLLFWFNGSLAFLETDATCLLIFGTLFGNRTFMTPSQVALAWVIRILASSLVTTQYLTGWNFFLSLMSWVSSMIHLWLWRIPLQTVP